MKGVVPIWFILGILFRTHEPCYDFASNGLEDFHHPNETTLYYIYIRVYRSMGGRGGDTVLQTWFPAYESPPCYFFFRCEGTSFLTFNGQSIQISVVIDIIFYYMALRSCIVL